MVYLAYKCTSLEQDGSSYYKDIRTLLQLIEHLARETQDELMQRIFLYNQILCIKLYNTPSIILNKTFTAAPSIIQMR